MRILAIVVSVVLIGCGGSAGQAEVQARLEALEARVDRLEGMGGGDAELGTGRDRPKRSASTVNCSGGPSKTTVTVIHPSTMAGDPVASPRSTR
mgnify:CR=1 FL=1